MERKHLIGGTDAATLLGIGRESKVALYLRLRGELANTFEGNDATEAGQLFEDGVVVPLAARRLGLTLVRPAEQVLVHPYDVRLGASLDFEVEGRNEFADAKLTSWREKWGDDLDTVPLNVAAQMQWQLAMARARGRAVPCVHVIAFMIPGYTLRDFPVEEDREIGDYLVGTARQFLADVEAGNAPKPEDEAQARLLYMAKKGMRVATETEHGLVLRLAQVQAARKAAETEEQAIKDLLIPMIGEHEELVDESGQSLVTYRARQVFDEDLFKAREPHLWHASLKQKFDMGLAKAAIGRGAVGKLELYKRDPRTPAESVRSLLVKAKVKGPQ